jgi:uncharacterized membrane protein
MSKENPFTKIKKPLLIGSFFIVVASILYIFGSIYISAVIFYILYIFVLNPLVLFFFMGSGFRVLYVLSENSTIKASRKGTIQKVFFFSS